MAEPTDFPTGTTIYDHSAAYGLDVLFGAPDDRTYLIDMDGHVIRRWDHGGQPSRLLDPALAGGVKGVVGLQLALRKPAAQESVGLIPGAQAMDIDESFGFVDWDDKILWQWGLQAPDGVARQNHDWDKLPDGNLIVLSYVLHKIPGFGDREMVDDAIYEVDPGGRIVWSWLVSDHFAELGFTPEEMKLVEQSPGSDFLHMNAAEALGPNHWEKSGDRRFAADNIMVSSRNANFVLIIDRGTGKVVWRIGPDYPPRNSGRGPAVPRPLDQISGQHDPHMIHEGLPGAGNILIFDDEGEAGYPPVALPVLTGSRVLEVDPASRDIVWEYTAVSSGRADWTFYSSFLGSAQRLPNGNTLIDEGMNGRFFQVTTSGKIVWEYVSPFTGRAPTPPAPGHPPGASSFTYRIQGVPYSWIPDSAADPKAP